METWFKHEYYGIARIVYQINFQRDSGKVSIWRGISGCDWISWSILKNMAGPGLMFREISWWKDKWIRFSSSRGGLKARILKHSGLAWLEEIQDALVPSIEKVRMPARVYTDTNYLIWKTRWDKRNVGRVQHLGSVFNWKGSMELHNKRCYLLMIH